MVRPFHYPSMIKVHEWDHVNKQGIKGLNKRCLKDM